MQAGWEKSVGKGSMTTEQSKTSEQPSENNARQDPLTSIAYAKNVTIVSSLLPTKLEIKVAMRIDDVLRRRPNFGFTNKKHLGTKHWNNTSQ